MASTSQSWEATLELTTSGYHAYLTINIQDEHKLHSFDRRSSIAVLNEEL